MAERPARKPRKARSAQVVRTERLTPHMQRVVLGGEGLADLPELEYTDHYVKLLFAPEGATLPEPLDMERVREELPRDQWPVTRTYTVRAWNPETRELTLD
ncbi:siderophore-interacting protein, partial [Streptomyces albidoflavus]